MNTQIFLILGILWLALGCGVKGKKGSDRGPGDADGQPQAVDLGPIAGQANTLDQKSLALALDELIAAETELHTQKVPTMPCSTDHLDQILAQPAMVLMHTAGVQGLEKTGNGTVTPPASSDFLTVEPPTTPSPQFATSWREKAHFESGEIVYDTVTRKSYGGNADVVYGLREIDTDFTSEGIVSKDVDLFVYDRQAKVLKTFTTSLGKLDPSYGCEDFGKESCATIEASVVDFGKASVHFESEIMDADKAKHTSHDYQFTGTFASIGEEISGTYSTFFGDGIASLGKTSEGEIEHEFAVEHSQFSFCYHP